MCLCVCMCVSVCSVANLISFYNSSMISKWHSTLLWFHSTHMTLFHKINHESYIKIYSNQVMLKLTLLRTMYKNHNEYSISCSPVSYFLNKNWSFLKGRGCVVTVMTFILQFYPLPHGSFSIKTHWLTANWTKWGAILLLGLKYLYQNIYFFSVVFPVCFMKYKSNSSSSCLFHSFILQTIICISLSPN